MNSNAGLMASALLFLAEFFIYGINSLVWAFATDIGGRTFSGAATGILDCAAYIRASMQSIISGGLIDQGGNWNLTFYLIIGVIVVMIVASLLANTKTK